MSHYDLDQKFYDFKIEGAVEIALKFAHSIYGNGDFLEASRIQQKSYSQAQTLKSPSIVKWRAMTQLSRSYDRLDKRREAVDFMNRVVEERKKYLDTIPTSNTEVHKSQLDAFLRAVATLADYLSQENAMTNSHLRKTSGVAFLSIDKFIGRVKISL
jgi:hypothetical protein